MSCEELPQLPQHRRPHDPNRPSWETFPPPPPLQRTRVAVDTEPSVVGNLGNRCQWGRLRKRAARARMQLEQYALVVRGHMQQPVGVRMRLGRQQLGARSWVPPYVPLYRVWTQAL